MIPNFGDNPFQETKRIKCGGSGCSSEHLLQLSPTSSYTSRYPEMHSEVYEKCQMPWKDWKFKLKMPFNLKSTMDADSTRYSLVEEENNNPAKGLASPTRDLPYKTFFFTLLALNIIAVLAAGVAFKYINTEEILGFDPPGYVPETFTPHHSKSYGDTATNQTNFMPS